MKQVATDQGVKPGALMPLMRFSLSGQSRGPGVTTIAHLIGQNRAVARLQRAVDEILSA